MVTIWRNHLQISQDKKQAHEQILEGQFISDKVDKQTNVVIAFYNMLKLLSRKQWKIGLYYGYNPRVPCRQSMQGVVCDFLYQVVMCCL